jgi:hypothetical protein
LRNWFVVGAVEDLRSEIFRQANRGSGTGHG